MLIRNHFKFRGFFGDLPTVFCWVTNLYIYTRGYAIIILIWRASRYILLLLCVFVSIYTGKSTVFSDKVVTSKRDEHDGSHCIILYNNIRWAPIRCIFSSPPPMRVIFLFTAQYNGRPKRCCYSIDYRINNNCYYSSNYCTQ